MQAGYFATVWKDIKNSPGWISKFFLLSLVSLIPIFGSMVLLGYFYGWARDIAWNVHRPLPQKIFGNEDGRLYSRGFFLLVISFVFTLVLGVVYWFIGFVTGFSFSFTDWFYWPFAFGLDLLIAFSICILTIGMALFVSLFVYVGSMRTTIYGTLSAGFQIGKIWSMMRHDIAGLFRILGMSLLLSLIYLIVSTVLIVVLSIVFAVGMTLLIAIGSEAYGAWSVGAFIAAIVLIFLYLAAIVFSVAFAEVVVTAFLARALGYWTRQFRVDQWRGQDDPMPFEIQQSPVPPQH